MSTDFVLLPRGSIWLLTPLTMEASDWCFDNLPKDASRLAKAFAIETRYVDNIVNGVQNDGFTVTVNWED